MQPYGKCVHPPRTDPVRPRVARQDTTDDGQVSKGGNQPKGSASSGDEKTSPNQHGLPGRHGKGEARLFQEEKPADDCYARNFRIHGAMSCPASLRGALCERSKAGPDGPAQRAERFRTRPTNQSTTSTMITSHIRLTRPPVAWNSNQMTKRMTATTSNAWITWIPPFDLDQVVAIEMNHAQRGWVPHRIIRRIRRSRVRGRQSCHRSANRRV